MVPIFMVSMVLKENQKLTKKSFSEDIIKILEDLKWWDKSIEKIQNIIPIITKANPTKDELLYLIK